MSGQIHIIAEGMCQEEAEGMGCTQCDVANNEDADGSALKSPYCSCRRTQVQLPVTTLGG